MIYLDNSATTAVCPEAAQKAMEMMTERFGNPSSLHTLGVAAETAVSDARAEVARVLGCEPTELIFTSGGTEANNLAVLGGARARRRRGQHIVFSAVEHPSVTAAAKRLEEDGFSVTFVPPQPDGRILPSDLLAACRADTVLVSVMLVNNETGATFPLSSVIPRIRKRSPLALIHSDGVQAVGKLPIALKKWDVDLFSMSGHKLHAPKGVGVLYCRKGVRLLPPAALGGGQEKEIRSGTENTPAIAALGEALKVLPAPLAFAAHAETLRAHLLTRLQNREEIRLHLPQDGAPHILNFSVMGLRSETVIHFMAERDIYLSGGSACSKGHKSPVLTAMGLPEPEIDSALRVSFSHHNTLADVDALCDALDTAIATLIHRRT